MRIVSLKANVFANFVGRGWQILLSIAVVPIYLKALGPESYGLIGFFVSLQSLLTLFDLGLGGALCRELARNSIDQSNQDGSRNLVKTLEMVYWGIGVLVGGVLLLISGFIAKHWLKAEQISAQELQYALVYMILAIVIQWPSSLYMSGLIGLQRQVLVNFLNITVSTFRVVGSVVVLWKLPPAVETFFIWQIVASIFQLLLTRWLLWKSLSNATEVKAAVFDVSILRSIWKFAAGLSATSIVMVVLGQADKLILSALLPLKVFGYYMLANTIAQSINLLPAPITDAMFPRYSGLVALNSELEVIRLFNKSCQFVSGLVFPLAAVLIFYSDEVLWLWTGDKSIAKDTWQLASILVIGVALNSAMSMLDSLQMAYGWMKPAFYSRVLALFIMGPLMYFLILQFGAIGAAIAWVLIYSGYLAFTPHFVFSRILKTEKITWYLGWSGPFLVSVIVAWMFKYTYIKGETYLLKIIEVSACYVLTFIFCTLTLPEYRQLFLKIYASLMGKKIG